MWRCRQRFTSLVCLSSLVSFSFMSITFPSLSKPLFLHFIDLLCTHSPYTWCTKLSRLSHSVHHLSLSSLTSSTPQHSQPVHTTYETLNSLSFVFYHSHSLYTRCTKPWQTWMASQSYFIVLTVRTRDVRNHDRLPPVWGLLRLAPITHHWISGTIGESSQPNSKWRGIIQIWSSFILIAISLHAC